MKFGPRRGHIACIFDNFFKDFGLVLIALLVGLASGDMEILLENVGILVIVLLAPVLRVLGYLTTTYEIDEEKLLIRSGLITKNTLEVPLSTITTVDFSQNLLHQILGVYRLNIDNHGNIADGQTKVHLTLKKDAANIVKGLLVKGRQSMDGSNFAGEQNAFTLPHREKGTRYTVKIGDILLMGLMKSKLLFLFEFFGAFIVIAELLPTSFYENIEGIDRLTEGMAELGVTMTVLLMAVTVFFIGSLCGMIGSLIRYYGFVILDNGQAVKIEYGLLNRKTYTIAKSKISGVFYQQSALMRIARVGVLYLMAVGYGAGGDEESSEEALLFPLLKKSQMKATICKILPELEVMDDYQKPEPKAMRYFFIRPSVLFGLVVLVGTCLLPKVNTFFRGAWILGAILLLWLLLGAFLEYKTTGVYGNEKHFSLCNGSYKKWTYFVKTAMIESIKSYGSIWKRKRGIGNIEIGCLAPMGQSTQLVCNLPTEAFEKLKTYLIY